MNDPCYPSSGDGMLSFEQAVGFLLDRARVLADVQEVDTEQALGRVLAAQVCSAVDVPPWDNSAMDGYAVRSADVAGAQPRRLPVTQRISAGALGGPLAAGSAARIFTGAPLPPGADAVVMQEHCTLEQGQVLIPGPVEPGANVRPRGNDISAGEVVLAPGTRIRPQEMGLAASVGAARLSVTRPLRVAVFSTGDELAAPGDALQPGQIYNSNRYSLHGLLQALGCEIDDLGSVPDDYGRTRGAILEAAARADLILTSGGVSVGEEDHVKRAVQSCGSLDLWKVRVKPGKPVAYGRVGEADFLGVPGNPVSALVTFALFVRPFILRRLGMADPHAPRLPVRADFAWPRPGKRREFLRARLVPGGQGGARVQIFPRQGSDVLTSTVWADGLVEIAEGATVAPGDPVAYLPFCQLLS